jgi:aquaporin Z
MRGDFPWKRVPGYILAQLAGACLATLLLVALLGAQGTAGLTLPEPSISATTAMLVEIVLTAGLVSVILGTASGAQNVGSMNAMAVAGCCVGVARGIPGVGPRPSYGRSRDDCQRCVQGARAMVVGRAGWSSHCANG